MSKFLREEDISMGFRAPLYSVPVCIPECLYSPGWTGQMQKVRNSLR